MMNVTLPCPLIFTGNGPWLRIKKSWRRCGSLRALFGPGAQGINRERAERKQQDKHLTRIHVGKEKHRVVTVQQSGAR